MFTTTPAAAAVAARTHQGYTVPNFRPALVKALDYAKALHYSYIRMRIEAELRGPAGRLVRREDLSL